MHLFVYEHITGGGLAGAPLPSSLAREGWAMLTAIVEDLLRIRNVHVTITVDERYAGGGDLPPSERLVVRDVSSANAAEEAFASCARECNGVLIIAPETHGVLLEKTRRALDLNAEVFGSAPEAIRLTGDKLECARFLEQHDVPCIPAVEYRSDVNPPFDAPWVVKPRDGAGTTDTLLLNSAGAQHLHDLRFESEAIVTPFCEGVAASVLCVVCDATILTFAPAAQCVEMGERLRYVGGQVPLSSELIDRAIRLGCRAVSAVPTLRGFVGVDLILGTDDRVVEINPRLTTSYVGLRRLTRDNLAACWLSVLRGNEVAGPCWDDGEVVFSPSRAARAADFIPTPANDEEFLDPTGRPDSPGNSGSR